MARKPQIKMSSLMQMTAAEIGRLSESELRGAYQSVRRTATSRVKTFEKHGREAPGLLKSLTRSSKEMSIGDIRQAVRTAAYQYREHPAVTSYGAWQEQRETFREKMQEALPEVDLSDEEKLDRFGEFMGDMQARYKAMWHAISEFVVDLYNDAVEIGEDPRRLMDNYEEWAAQVRKEEHEAIAAGRKKGRRRSTSVKTFRRVSGIKRKADYRRGKK